MTGPYQLVFMPYLALGGRDRIQIGNVEIWNYDRQKTFIGNDPLRARVDELLSMYRQNGRDADKSTRLRDIGVVIVGGECGLQPLRNDEFEKVQEARHLLFLCCLSKNCLLRGPDVGHKMITSENFEIIRQNFVLDSPYISEVTGAILRIQIGGYTISGTKFTKPTYVNLPFRFETDELLLEALLSLRGSDPTLFRRITRAAGLFLESYYNSHSVDMGARVLLQAAAYEVLFELPKNGPRKTFKDQIEALMNVKGERVYEYRYEARAGSPRERRTLKGMWADRFYTLRNHIVHGEDVSPREFRFLRAQHHLTISPLMFSQCVKRLVDAELQSRKQQKRFFERVDWTVIQEKDEYEPCQVGFEARIDFEARIQRWIDDGGTLT
jgi:hypothetical protein